MRTLYFDCFAGASGNMILGGLIALGVDRVSLVGELSKLNISDFKLDVTAVDRSGILSTHVEVKVPHEHVHRHLHDIEKIVNGSELSESVKERATKIFSRLAQAEAKVHGIDVNKVHFHEVGAMDAIIDVVGSCIGFEMLSIERFACSKIHVGSGFVNMAHGKFPVPPPAVAELLQNVPIYSTEIEGELITPTGAAIISTVCDSYGQLPEMLVEHTAYGAGTRAYEKFPNVLRMMIGTSHHVQRTTNNELLTLLETNIDDLSPQILGYVMERAFEFGALDCWFTPIQMKKNRPATMIAILCDAGKRELFSNLLYEETSTLGIRFRQVERECLERESVAVTTEYGPIEVKVGRIAGRIVNAMPEYEQVRTAAIENGIAFRIIADAAMTEFNRTNAASKAKAQG
jgi:uncharacterized protein (TIGR00299 family) protein